MNPDPPEFSQVDSPLVTKRDPAIILNKLVAAISVELREYLTKSEARTRHHFFGADQDRPHLLDKKKIVENTLVQLRQLKHSPTATPLIERFRQLSLILLDAKLQSLSLYISHGSKPIMLDQHLDNCLSLCQKQIRRLKSEPGLKNMFEALLITNQIEATQAIYQEYDKKVLALGTGFANARGEQQVTVFHQELLTLSQNFAAKATDPDLLQHPAQCLKLLREERHRIMNLEPEVDGFVLPELHKAYQWAIKAVSKLGGYSKSLNERLAESLHLDQDISPPKNLTMP